MSYRKLGRTGDQRKAMLRGLVTALLQNGKIVTTETRAKEVQSIAENLITSAVKEADNFESKQVTFSKAKVNSKGKYITITKKSKNGNDYPVRERETKTELRRVDMPSRLAARRRAIAYIYPVKDADGNNLKIVSKLFDEIAPKYKDKKGGYTRIVKIGARRGDGAPMAILELA
ncbi:MAG: 50S ribosomal protein L17 [Clostridia bacterium]|nr:50S ribosomal protein L17 [Clostridia bacterium]MCR5693415.1 50S ribosomal protein L17 [Clostridia bacterium]